MIGEITKQVDHRPWPLPSSPWTMTQRWHDLLFAHWPIQPEVMRALVPPALALDTFQGNAWLGLVPFRMSDVRPRWVPSVPWLSAFPEFNIRTYVKSRDTHNPRPGVWFFSLDAANPVAVSIARNVYKLPYFRAKMALTDDGQKIQYHQRRTHTNAPAADFIGHYGPTGNVSLAEPGTIDHWLTERYCLYTVDQENVYRAEIHHKPWPLQPAYLHTSVNTMADSCGITLPNTEPLLHFARHLDVVVWPLHKIESA